MEITPSQVLSAMQWRYATKRFDSTQRIPEDVWAVLRESLVLSPSSLGLQLWQFIEVKSPELRQALHPVSWGQPQVLEADKFIVFTVRRDYTQADMERHLQNICQVRGLDRSSQDGYAQRIQALLSTRTPAEMQAWMRQQLYIALGVMMSSAAMLRVDTCALEGIDVVEYDRILGLENTPYQAVVALALGYRGEDGYAQLAKVRYPKSEVIVRV